jgi:hypothetical protein
MGSGQVARPKFGSLNEGVDDYRWETSREIMLERDRTRGRRWLLLLYVRPL